MSDDASPCPVCAGRCGLTSPQLHDRLPAGVLTIVGELDLALGLLDDSHRGGLMDDVAHGYVARAAVRVEAALFALRRPYCPLPRA